MSVIIKNLTNLTIDISNLTGAWEPSQSLKPHLALILKVSYLTVCLLGLVTNLLLLTIIVGMSGVQCQIVTVLVFMENTLQKLILKYSDIFKDTLKDIKTVRYLDKN